MGFLNANDTMLYIMYLYSAFMITAPYSSMSVFIRSINRPVRFFFSLMRKRQKSLFLVMNIQVLDK